jgi:hypothetical protein
MGNPSLMMYRGSASTPLVTGSAADVADNHNRIGISSESYDLFAF